jgi:superfamily I DNA/RNA helicase
MLALTEEQQAVVEAAKAGGHLKVVAFAGAGKTSTLVEVAKELEGKRILYLTFSRALANEARGKFAGLAEAMTNHALAFHKTGKPFVERRRLQGSLFAARKRLAEDLPEADALLQWRFRDRDEAMFAILAVVNQFIQSDSEKIGPEHIPDLLRGDLLSMGEKFEDFAACLVPIAQRAWDLLSNYEAPYPVSHDLYLKLYQLSHPSLPYDAILFDEAQDANPAMLGILLPQEAQRIFVGDPHQQIYAWRGAVNAMERLNGQELTLSQSFRFSGEIAKEATEILYSFKGETRLVRGISSPKSDNSIVILSRSNAGALIEVLSLLNQGYRVALVNNVEELTESLEAAYRLYKGLPPRHPEFSLFRSWGQMVALIQKFNFIATQYQPFQKLVETYKDDIPRISDRLRHSLVKEDQADAVVSTAHRSKGREWDGVKLAEDFANVTLAQVIRPMGCVMLYPEEANLVYVAFTRARTALNKGAFGAVLDMQKHLAIQARKRGRLCSENLKEEIPGTPSQPASNDTTKPQHRKTLWEKIFGS